MINEENLTGYCTNGLIEAEFLKKTLSVHIGNCSHTLVDVPDIRRLTYVGKCFGNKLICKFHFSFSTSKHRHDLVLMFAFELPVM